MDVPTQLDIISMGLPIMYFKGSWVEICKLWCISVPGGCFNLRKQCTPWCNGAFVWVFTVCQSIRLGFPLWKELMRTTRVWIKHCVTVQSDLFKPFIKHQSRLQQTTNLLTSFRIFEKIRYDISWESSASRRFSWNTMPYLLFLKKRQNLNLSPAANYRWRFKG